MIIIWLFENFFKVWKHHTLSPTKSHTHIKNEIRIHWCFLFSNFSSTVKNYFFNFESAAPDSQEFYDDAEILFVCIMNHENYRSLFAEMPFLQSRDNEN